MKKLFWFFCVILPLSLASCTSTSTNQSKEESDEAEPAMGQLLEYSTVNIGTVSILDEYLSRFWYDFNEVYLTGTVILYRDDTVWLDIPTTNPQEQLIIKIANQEPNFIPIGTQVKIRAEVWAGGWESGWIYTIADDNPKVYSKLTKWKEDESIRKTNTQLSKSQEIPTGREIFQKLVNYIEKNGFVVTERGVPCDHQVTFYDSKGNRHALITIKRDKNKKPSVDGTVDQISVWAYVDGIKDQDHSFGYGIDSNTVFPFVLESDGTWANFENVEIGFQEFLKLVERI